MTILLLGESNPYSRDPDDALLPWPENAAGDRLRRILNMKSDEYLATFTRANLCGARWSMPAAVAEARVLLDVHTPQLVIALGIKVCGAVCRATNHALIGAFGCEKVGVEGLARVLALPHPSGRNRIWQIPGTMQRARDAFAEARNGITNVR